MEGFGKSKFSKLTDHVEDDVIKMLYLREIA
jgi:hypothetical protein